MRRLLAIPFLALAMWLFPSPAMADAGGAPAKKVEMKAETAPNHASKTTPGKATPGTTKAKKNGPKAEMKAKKAPKKHASNVAPEQM
jgi:hypothetical protein